MMNLNPETKINELDVSRRTINALARNKIFTVDDLLNAAANYPDFTLLKGVGLVSADEIYYLVDEIVSSSSLVIPPKIIPTFSFGEFWQSVQKGDYQQSRDYHIVVERYNTKIKLRELGAKYGISTERVRQIIVRGNKKIRTAFTGGSIYPEIIHRLDESALHRTKIQDLQISDPVFTDSGIAYLVATIKENSYKVLDLGYLQDKWFISSQDPIANRLDALFEELKYGDTPLTEADIVNRFSVDMKLALNIRGLIEQDGYYTHEQNRLTVARRKNDIILDYLESIDRPSSIEEIINHTGLSANQVRTKLCDKDYYINVSKTTYDLKDRDYSNLTIEDLFVNILTARNVALKIDEIVDYVRIYKDFGDRDIYASILNSSKIYRLGDYILLKGWQADKIVHNKRSRYQTTLEDAVLEIISSNNEIYNSDKILAKLLEYDGAVSTNINSIRATLIHLADKNLISRVGNTKTGCYTRSQHLN